MIQSFLFSAAVLTRSKYLVGFRLLANSRTGTHAYTCSSRQPFLDTHSYKTKTILGRIMESIDGEPSVEGAESKMTNVLKRRDSQGSPTVSPKKKITEEAPSSANLKSKKKKIKKPKAMPSNPSILMDLHSLNPKFINSTANKEFLESLFVKHQPYSLYEEYEVDIIKMASDGTGIGISKDHPDWFVLVPFTYIGDRAKVKINSQSRGYSEADLISILSRSEDREDKPACKYFGTCSGCHWQHLDYEMQLKLKAEFLKRAFLYGGRAMMDRVPFATPEHSPLKLSYRTKITPHFDRPKSDTLPIGFNKKGWRRIMDIEDCILATPPVSIGYKQERARVLSELSSFKNGATLVIRESVQPDGKLGVVTNHKATVTQKVGDLTFEYPAGSFFQINGSILPRMTQYVMDEFRNIPGLTKPPRYLLDVYCGSGLFAVACASAFEKVVGVDVSNQSIDCATGNANKNNLSNCSFKLGEAQVIFNGLEFSGDETAVIIDPPRKGCDADFIRQLIDFGPSAIVYISCNPFTQAQDLQLLLNLTGGLHAQESLQSTSLSEGEIMSPEAIRELAPDYLPPKQAQDQWDTFQVEADAAFVDQYSGYLNLDKEPVKPRDFTYRIVKAKPFDLFPQTMHIESLVTLVKVPLPL